MYPTGTPEVHSELRKEKKTQMKLFIRKET